MTVVFIVLCLLGINVEQKEHSPFTTAMALLQRFRDSGAGYKIADLLTYFLVNKVE